MRSANAAAATNTDFPATRKQTQPTSAKYPHESIIEGQPSQPTAKHLHVPLERICREVVPRNNIKRQKRGVNTPENENRAGSASEMSQNLENGNHQSALNRQDFHGTAERSPSRRERRSAAAGGPAAGLQGGTSGRKRNPEQARVVGAAWPPSCCSEKRRRIPERERAGGGAGAMEQRESEAATVSQLLTGS